MLPVMDHDPDLAFLHKYPAGQGRLILNGPDASRHVFERLNMSIVQKNCPLLALSFESSAHGPTTAHLDVPSIAAGICLVRFIYDHNYATCADPKFEFEVSMLLTAHITMLATCLDYSELYTAANSSLLAKIDFAASFPFPPHSLCATIRFIWTNNFAANIKESILNYCVASFKEHDLGHWPEFIKLSEEHIDFHMDLSRVNCERGYDEPAILLLPGPKRTPPYPDEDDWSTACAFSDADGDDVLCDDESDNNDEEQPVDKPRPLFLDIPMRPKQNQQTEPEIASVPCSPALSDDFVVVEDPFKSTFDSDSESGWEVVE